MLEIKGEIVEDELDVKRFYMPGIVLKSKCPKCGASCEIDLSQEYLSYPTVNKPFDHLIYCDECDHEWEERLILKIKLEKG